MNDGNYRSLTDAYINFKVITQEPGLPLQLTVIKTYVID